MATSNSAAIILNPASGQGDPRRRKVIAQAAKQAGWSGTIIETTPDRLANFAVAQEFERGQRHFVICGGDGTVTESLEVLVNQDATIGIVPLGTGNLLAKNLHLPLEVHAAMGIALHGQPVKIDIGQANHLFFAVMAGIGLDAEIMQQTNRQLKNKFGQLAYYWSAFKNMHSAPVKYQIEVDGRAFRTTARTVLVANFGKITGNLEAVLHTSHDDGVLNIGIIRARTILQFLDLVSAAIKGNINHSRQFKLLHGQNITITPIGQPQPFQCDGNDYPPTQQLAITIHPESVSIMTQPHQNNDAIN